MEILLEGAGGVARLGGRIGPLPFTGYDLVVLAAVVMATIAGALWLRHAVARARSAPAAAPARAWLGRRERDALAPVRAARASDPMGSEPIVIRPLVLEHAALERRDDELHLLELAVGEQAPPGGGGDLRP